MPQPVRDAYAKFDRDGSGDIDASELRLALSSLGVPAETMAQAASLLSIYDANRSARLSLFEFHSLVTEITAGRYGSTDSMGPLLRQREPPS